MSLRFAAGSSGAGKSYKIYKELIEESRKYPEKQYLVIVPDQFTMQTQKELVDMHPEHGMLNLDVLSFTRLAWRVFEEVGGNTLPVLEETGKSLIIQKVVAAHKKELQLLGRTMSRQGAIAEMKSLISELLQYRVRPADMEAWITEQKGSRLGRKLADVQTIYAGFEAYLEDHYLTAEELPELLCSVIGESALVRDSVIVLDGFTGFTPVQNQVVRELLRLSERLTVVVTIDPAEELFRRDGMHRLFHMSHEMVHTVMELARETHTEVEPVWRIEAGEKSRFSGSPALAFLEQNLFRYKTNTYETLPEEIRITEAASPAEELRGAAQEICRLVREKKYHYRDIAIVTGDMDTYGEEAEKVLTACGIPVFLDRKKPVLTNPMVEFIRSALDMVVQRYSYDSVFRFLRSGLTGFSLQEVDEMETYCRALGIRGRKQYEETWVRCFKGMDPEKLLYYQELQKRFLDMTTAFHEGLQARKATAAGRTEVLYYFLTQNRIQEQVENYRTYFAGKGQPVREKEYAQIYEAVIDLLDKTVELLGEEKMGTAEYAEILDAGFREMAIGLVPPGEDQIMIGDIERTRLKKIRVQFFVGINEGNVPKKAGGRGILSEFDRENIKSSGKELSPTAREEMYRQRFYLYLNMTKPSDRLYVSYSRTDAAGGAQLPSYLIGTIRKLFPKLEIRTLEHTETVLDRLETPEGREDFLLEGIRNTADAEPQPELRELVQHLLQTPEGAARIRRLFTAALTRNREGQIGERLARKLYGDTLYASVSRLENFSGCAFKHFLDYGLRLQEREEYTFTPADFGSIMHEALERYSKNVRKERLNWGEVSEKDRNRLADQALDEVVYGFHNTILASTNRNRHMIERIRQILRRTVWALEMQIRQGEFRPSDFEFVFRESDPQKSTSFSLAGGRKVCLNGVIDRLDACVRDGKRYIKIIDYKTGKKTLDLNQLYAGMQLQLVVYMNAALEREQKEHPDELAEPAGIFYYHIEDPLVEADASDKSTEEQILELLRPTGRVRSEKEILQLLDRDLEGGVRSRVIPVKLNKDGTPDRYSQVAGEEEFQTIRNYAMLKTRQICNSIAEGNVQALPAVQADMKSTACDWCGYRGICGFEENIPGFVYRKLEKRAEDDLLNRMRKELGDAAGKEEDGTDMDSDADERKGGR
ncbi:MAG: helicase-exonuclease AddAB subunit AddB [Eubacteriales bacterium]|nr:helicase-exonuclease AddAB subunit AddB [Eubacteriales bacterium]